MKLRETSRNILHPETIDSDAKSNSIGNFSPTSSFSSDTKADKKVTKSKKNKNKKPAWAKSEKDTTTSIAASETDTELADLVGTENADEELDELLDFAQGLNYKKYLNDMEIKTMMEQVRKRIVDLERQVNQEEKRDNDVAVDKARKEILALKELSKGPQYAEEDYEIDEEDANLEAAKEVLKLNEDIKAVHSTKSATALVKQARNEPIIVVHDQNEGARTDDTAKNAVSNLPYMHRNPAI